MKRIRIVWAMWLLAMLPLHGVMAAELFQEGRDYTVLSKPQPVETGDKIELREFFWYGCPHCFILEPVLDAYVAKLPKNVAFVRTPGAAPHWVMQARAFYAFEVLGVTQKLHKPFFEAWHVKNRRMNDEESITQFATEHGVDKAKFKETFNSFAVHTRLEKGRQQNVGAMIEGVPTLVIDGRYVTAPTMAGGNERDEVKRSQMTMKVVDFLIQKAAKERKKPAAKG